MLSKSKWATLVAEFLGTYILVSAFLAMFARTSFPFFAAAAAGLAYAALLLIFNKVSGGHFNPAVTLGLWSIKKFPTTDSIAFVAAQMVAGFTALRVNQYLLGQEITGSVTETWEPIVVVAEVIGAFVFAFGLAAALEYANENGKLPAVAGLFLFLGILVASFGSNGTVNPAVALGINSFSVSYVVGPLVGAILAFNAYYYLFAATPLKVRVLRTSVSRSRAKKTPAKKRRR